MLVDLDSTDPEIGSECNGVLPSNFGSAGPRKWTGPEKSRCLGGRGCAALEPLLIECLLKEQVPVCVCTVGVDSNGMSDRLPIRSSFEAPACPGVGGEVRKCRPFPLLRMLVPKIIFQMSFPLPADENVILMVVNSLVEGGKKTSNRRSGHCGPYCLWLRSRQVRLEREDC